MNKQSILRQIISNVKHYPTDTFRTDYPRVQKMKTVQIILKCNKQDKLSCTHKQTKHFETDYLKCETRDKLSCGTRVK